MDLNVELMKYLSDDDRKRIAERVYEEECRRIFNEEMAKRDQALFHNQSLVYTRILDKYISEMDLVHEDFIPAFKDMITNYSKELLAEDSDVTLRYAISAKLTAICNEVFEENHDELKEITKEKVFKCCNEKLLIAFISDIVRSLNLNEAIKNLLRNDPEWQSD